MDIKENNLILAYKNADESGKNLLKGLFPDFKFEVKKPVMDRIKTYDDAWKDLGYESDPLEKLYDLLEIDEIAYKKLKIICKALNEEWKAEECDKECWYPYFSFYSKKEIEDMDDEGNENIFSLENYRGGLFSGLQAGVAARISYSGLGYASWDIGSRLCLRSKELSDYFGKQFIELWADFKLIRK